MLDQALYNAITRRMGTKPDAYSKAVARSDAATPPIIAAAFQTIDAKATGLLTHVSMMIAGLGISAPMLAQYVYEEAIIVAEICVYLLIAVGCLRCLSMFAAAEEGADAAATRRNAERELLIRRELYRFCHRAAIVFTILVFISLPIMLLWRPEG
jgi:hypothetical protein